jgi:L-threonylcarbamoyladenylate synthase
VAAAILRNGGTVAFPTETVYGLGANALDAHAVEKIFLAKQRPAWDPVIVHVTDTAMLERVVASVPENARRLMDAFWPGPLTLLLPKGEAVPGIVTAGRDRVGVRMPAHPVAHALIRLTGLPIAAPSANSFGRISPTLAAHVLEDLDGRIDAVVDAGETTHGLESTVVDACEDPLIVYRPGVITLEQIREVCGGARALQETPRAEAEPESLPSPGVGIRHYAPHARLVLIEGEGKAQELAFRDAAAKATDKGYRVGLMLPDGFHAASAAGAALVYRWGKWHDDEELAQRLFAGLRQLDAAGATLILCPLPSGEGIGVAIRDRLRKASWDK